MDEWTIIYVGSGITADSMGSDIWATLEKFMVKIDKYKPKTTNIAIGYQGIKKFTANNGHYLYSASQGKFNIKHKRTASFRWDLCDYKSITQFIKYVIQDCKFKAKKYMIIFSSHGAGLTLERRNGAAFCRGPNKRGVTVREMRTMMGNVKKLTGQPADVMLMDACLMQAISIPMALGSTANYYVASQPTINTGQALDYESFADLICQVPNISAKDLATNLTTKVYDKRSQMSLSAVDVQRTCSYDTKNVINSFARYLMMHRPNEIHSMLHCMGYLNQEDKNLRDIIALMQVSKRLARANSAPIDRWIDQIKSCRAEPYTCYSNSNSCSPTYIVGDHINEHPRFAITNQRAIKKATSFNNIGFKKKKIAYNAYLKDKKNWKSSNPTWKTDGLKYSGTVIKKPKKKNVPAPIYNINPNNYSGGGYNGMSIYMTDIRYQQTFFKEIGLGDWGDFLWYAFGPYNVYKLFTVDKPRLPDNPLSGGFHEIKYKTPTAKLLAENPNYSYEDYMRCRLEYDDE
ncbi:MAG: hypothetical protein GY750_17625 [Lentisphaerae bacterium]|nr:hypothetical protein [Lentisphaerota bacterium]MCP4103219.1 hypothetical protein [Lentisphaerota bacterium]